MSHATPAGAFAEEVLNQFNDAWNRHDLDAALTLTSTNCVYEAAGPSPSGDRSVGRAELKAVLKPLFEDMGSHLTVEESFTAGEDFMTGTRVVQRYRLDFTGGFVRGIDIVTVRDGLITEKLVYVKGG